MATYSEISNKWFTLRLPKGYLSLEDYEREAAPADRAKTAELISKMIAEAPLTADGLFGVGVLPKTRDSIIVLDRLITPTAADMWMGVSDPRDPENEFTLNISEFATWFGEMLRRQLGGEWKYARSPNYFESVVRIGTFELLPFDILMKKCSDDFSTETLLEKFDRFTSAVLKTN